MTQWGIDALFNPGKRHMDEEKRRLQSTREEIGDSSGGKRIDLESGKVKLGRKKPADPDSAGGAESSEAESVEAEQAETEQAETDSVEGEPEDAAADSAAVTSTDTAATRGDTGTSAAR